VIERVPYGREITQYPISNGIYSCVQ
jgi:hypothetical protein